MKNQYFNSNFSLAKPALLFLVSIIWCSFSVQAQSNNSTTEEIALKTQTRIEAAKGTYQLIFKDEASKEKFFASGILKASEYIGVEGIVTYSDLLIVIEENRLKGEEQNYVIGDNEIIIRVLPFDYIKSDEYQPLQEFIIK
ncbi:MAG: hypothetical protein WDZ35_15515 [Crocinitomicaceae bacterium]